MSTVVEGQLDHLQFTVSLAKISHSQASENMRTYVKAVSDQQNLTPMVIPANVDPQPTIEADTGKLITNVS